MKYLGDSVNEPSQTTVGVTVAQAGSTTQLTLTPTSVVVGQGTVTATATVASTGFTPGGNVEFYVNGTLAATEALTQRHRPDGARLFTTVANRTVVAKFVGDPGATASESTAKVVTVTKATPTMTVTVSPNPAGTKDRVSGHRLTCRDRPGRHRQRGRQDRRSRAQRHARQRQRRHQHQQDPEGGDYPVVVTYGGSTLAETVTQTISLVVRK